MLKRLGVAAALALALGIVPMAGHADVTKSCVALGDDGAFNTPGGLTCTYTAGTATGQIEQATPNAVSVTVTTGNITTTAYSQDSLTPPGQATFNTPVGSTVTVNVGPDTPPLSPQGGAIGLVVIGDAS